MKLLAKFGKKRVGLAAGLLALPAVVIPLMIRWFGDQPMYDYFQVKRQPMRVTLRESAVVGPEHRLNVTPPIAGRIDSLKVENGEAVKQGQILAWISSTDRAALMDAARAAGGKEIDFWEDVYKPAPLLAPLDGHIISTSVVPGQVIAPAQTAFTMSDHLIVQASVDETDLHQVSLNQEADITFDSFSNIRLTGKVHSIAYDATTINNVATYLVNIFLDETPDNVRSGITANVFLVISDRKNVLQIPTEAITSNGEVLLAKDRKREPVLQKIKVGEVNGPWSEVVEGVREGDWIACRKFTSEKKKKFISLLSVTPKKK